MKMILGGIVAAALIAFLASRVLDDRFQVTSEAAFTTSGARI
ncbi:hypothetical protein ACQW02_14380 [Humitalea sp. 24SJ18S-53]